MVCTLRLGSVHILYNDVTHDTVIVEDVDRTYGGCTFESGIQAVMGVSLREFPGPGRQIDPFQQVRISTGGSGLIHGILMTLSSCWSVVGKESVLHTLSLVFARCGAGSEHSTSEPMLGGEWGRKKTLDRFSNHYPS